MRYLIVLCALLLLAGCGTGGTATVVPTGTQPVLLAGKWAGTYVSQSKSDHGTITLQVGPGNGASGIITSQVTGLSAPMNGKSLSGQITMQYRFGMGSQIEAQFEVHIDTNHHMVGRMLQIYTTAGNQNGTGPILNIDLAPQ